MIRRRHLTPVGISLCTNAHMQSFYSQQVRWYRKIQSNDVSNIIDLRTKVQMKDSRSKPKKMYNFLTSDRFIDGAKEKAKPIRMNEGSRKALFSLANSYQHIIQARVRAWVEKEKVTDSKYFPEEIARRLALRSHKIDGMDFPVPGLIGHAHIHDNGLAPLTSNMILPFDLQLQAKHALLGNFARSPEASEWQKKLNLENVDLTKGIFRDRSLSDLLCYFVTTSYPIRDSIRLKVQKWSAESEIPSKPLIDELLTTRTGEPLINIPLRHIDLPLSHRAVVAAAILYRNHPLMPQSSTIIGSAKIRYDELVNNRSVESHTRTAIDRGHKIAHVLAPNYDVKTDMCGIVDFLDSLAYLYLSKSKDDKRLSSLRNRDKLFSATMLYDWKFSNRLALRQQHQPQFEFICRIVNTLSESEQRQLVTYIDDNKFRICREIEREVVGLSALTAYLVQRPEFRGIEKPRQQYIKLFDAASQMLTCTPTAYIPRQIFSTFSDEYRRRYSNFVPYKVIPDRGSRLWVNLYVRESNARGNRFQRRTAASPSKPFVYGDLRPRVTTHDFTRLSVLQRAALDFCFPARLSIGEHDKNYGSAKNNYLRVRTRELLAQVKKYIHHSHLLKLVAKEWELLPQEVKDQFNVKLIVQNQKASFPLSGNDAKDVRINIKNLPSEPIATPLAPISPDIQNRPHIVNLGRYKPSDEHIHKDPLTKIGFVDPCKVQSIEFFGNKALEILNTRLDAKRIMKNPSGSTIVKTITTEKSKHKVPSKLRYLPQYEISPVVLAELARSGLYDQKQPINFDFELSKEACDFRINTLRSENVFRTAIVAAYPLAKKVRNSIEYSSQVNKIDSSAFIDQMDDDFDDSK